MATLALVTLLALGLAARAHAAGWRVTLRGMDVTRTADPLPMGGQVLVDLTFLAPALGLGVALEGDQIRVRAPDGTRWHGQAGGSRLAGDGRLLDLGLVRREGPSLYVDAQVAAELAGLSLTVDPSARSLGFDEPPTDPASAEPAPPELAGVGGWQPIQLAKSAAEIRESARLSAFPVPSGRGAPPFRSLLPPAHDSLRLTLGLGYVEGADWASELSAAGSILGLGLELHTFLTAGPDGLEYQSGHLLLHDPELAWTAEAGDLASETWGFARGARFAFHQEGRFHPAVSVYTPDLRSRTQSTAVAFQGDFEVGAGTLLGGEVISDGSWLLHDRFRAGRLSLYGYLRHDARERGTDGAGVSGYLRLLPGWALQGGWSTSGRDALRSDRRNLALRFPLWRRSHVSLETNVSESGDLAVSRIDSMSWFQSMGAATVRLRYQVRRSELRALGGAPGSRSEQREILAALSFLAFRRLRFDAQLTDVLPEGGAERLFTNLVGSLRLDRHTDLRAIVNLADDFTVDDLRLALDRDLPGDLRLSLEWGNVPPYQSLALRQGFPDRDRFRILLRKSWRVSTPARGGTVGGAVTDPWGHGLSDVPVVLGRYRTATDEAGRYRFPHLPGGTYDLGLEEASLPAGYVAGDGRRELVVSRRTEKRIDLRALPLGTVSGRVVRREGGRTVGLEGVPLLLDGRATISGGDGRFHFDDVPPGVHRLHVARRYLPADLTVAVPWDLEVGLPAGRSLAGIELVLARQEKPVIFQELR